MKGNEKVLDALQHALSEELTAINQYFIHAELCEAWGYPKLHNEIKMNSIGEMKHAEQIMARILFLEGTPNMTEYMKITVGQNVQDIIKNDLALEHMAVKTYNEYIRIASDANDNGSRDLFLTLLKDEELHVDYLEAQTTLIEQVGIQNYLLTKV